MRIKRILLFMVLIFCLNGCSLDPYSNPKFGEQVIDSWFSYVDGENDLGSVRKSVEDIDTIEDKVCEFIEKYKDNYIFKCTLTYKEKGETVIPFSKSKTLDLYALFNPNSEDETFTYKVYNSSSKKNIWREDEELK